MSAKVGRCANCYWSSLELPAELIYLPRSEPAYGLLMVDVTIIYLSCRISGQAQDAKVGSAVSFMLWILLRSETHSGLTPGKVHSRTRRSG